jgi:hypothetical protein
MNQSSLRESSVVSRQSAVIGLWSLVIGLWSVSLSAHSGPPFPIVSNRVVGAYQVSVWTDPDATDDGSAAGQFWVMFEPSTKGRPLPTDVGASVAIRPLGRQGIERRGRTEPVNGEWSRQFVALVMDHEGPYAVRVTVDGPDGQPAIDAEVDATYDLRPRPILIVVYLMPFLLIGFLWLKLLLRRKRKHA